MSSARPATQADLARLCRTAVEAFVDDPVMRWFWPTDEEYFVGDGLRFRPFLTRLLAHGQTFTTDDGVAFAAFVPPGRPDVEVEPDPNPLPVSDDLAARFVAIGPVMAQNTPDESHWYLNVLATHPHWQRQGLGTEAMQPIVEVSERDGLPIYLETETLANVAYYSHLGFTVRSEWDVPLDGPHMWGMIRRPSS
jgi:GNAT superfamily N-acetyltransferase